MAFSAGPRADAPFFLSFCVFQSAEFFEMLEKMQVSIPKVGEPNPRVGRAPPRLNPRAERGALHGEAEEKGLTVPVAWTT